MDISQYDPKKYIIIKGAGVNNLKDIDVTIPRNKLVVITGLSGSGKSSLAFDTLFAEGQRRYVESLSAYARQFLGRMSKPKVDYILGISPAVAIEQKVNIRNPRSTVGTSTEIYEYMKLLYARIGKTFSPVSGKEVKRHSVADVAEILLELPEGTKIFILSPIVLPENRTFEQQLEILQQEGFTRIILDGKISRIEDVLSGKALKKKKFDLLVDRITIHQEDDELRARLGDAVQTAFFEGMGNCRVQILHEEQEPENLEFSNRFELDGITFEKPNENFFSFNNPYGACKTCEGFGSIIGIDEDLVVPNKTLSIYQDAVVCWRGEKMSEWKDRFVLAAPKFGFPIHKPYCELNKEQKEMLWYGTKHAEGIYAFFKAIEAEAYKIQYRVMLARYRGKTVCPDCHGTRLRADASYVKINKRSIIDLVLMPVSDLSLFFENLNLEDHEQKIAERILKEIQNRLQYLLDVGLGYLTLNRLSNTLSGGESQRINLATSLGSSLVGSMYILDEPSIGLHPRDTQNLIHVLLQLRDLGNTVIVVEHDEEIIRTADYIIDIGPLAGRNGGEVVFSGTFEEMLLPKIQTLTAKYLRNEEEIEYSNKRRKGSEFIRLINVWENNLKNITVKFPLNSITVVTGVSGSGKTSLVKTVLYNVLKKRFSGIENYTGKCSSVEGNLALLSDVELVDQNPIGRSSRSNPVTYLKAYDDIRQLYSEQPLAKKRSYKPGFFSFNVPGGRCEVCEGEGEITVEMQFMSDVHLLCEECKGTRFKEEVLEVKYRDKNVHELLQMTVSEALAFFSSDTSTITQRISHKLQCLEDVGLGYLQLGQSSSSLSGGEAQRIKLAFFLSKGNAEKPVLFIFDEPSTGLHFHDIKKLNRSFEALIKKGHSIIIIEHHTDIIKIADWVIDMGPEGGENGGTVVFEGTPEDLVKCKKSYTGQFLKGKL